MAMTWILTYIGAAAVAAAVIKTVDKLEGKR